MSRRVQVRVGVTGAAVVLALAAAVAVFGQAPPGPMPQPGMAPGAMPQPGMGPGPGPGPGAGMCPMCAHMMGSMTQGAALAVTNDAVYVLVGNKVLRYTRTLDLVKEAEIAMDMPKMHRMMQEMMENCPMRKQMGTHMRMPGSPPDGPR